MSETGETLETAPTGDDDELPAPGTVMDRYRIVEQLGAGGMGVVFRAVDVDLERSVALKVLRPARRSDEARARLLDEARAMAKLRHPGVVTVHDVGTAAGHDFIAMELVAGEDLAAWGRKRRRWRDVVQVYLEAGRGLAAAHAAGVVHRDFKPGNVLIDLTGRVAVGDFGLARGVDDDAGGSAGTPAYMAPEQLDGDAVDARADQFSFCVALAEALSGRRPIAGDSAAELDVGAAPRRIRRAIARGLSLDRAARHPDLAALLGELDGALRARRRRGTMIGVALMAAAAVAAVTIGLRGRGGAAADGCDGDPFAAAWPGGRDGVAAALAGRPAARDTVLGGLDRYRDGWRARWTATCRRTPRDDAGFHQVAACLLDARDHTASLVGELAAPAPATTLLDDAVAAVEALPDPVLCEVPAGPAPPADPAVRAQVRAIEAELARIRGLVPSRPRAAAAAARDAVAAAATAGHPPLVARALLLLGQAQLAIPEVAAARATLADAVLAAEEAGDDEVRARGLVELAVLEVDFSSDLDGARKATRRAAASVARDHRDPALRAELLIALTTLAERDGDHAAALAYVEEAAQILEARGALVELGAAHRTQAWVLRSSGDKARSLALLEATLARLEAGLGPDHPETVTTLVDVAFALGDLGRHDDARVRIEEASRRRPPDPFTGAHAITGVVVDGAGRPVAGAEVVINSGELRGDGRAALQAHDRFGHRGIVGTDDAGRFLVTVDPGKYLVIAEAESAGRSEAWWVEVDRDQELRLVLAPWAELHGRITGEVPTDAHLHVSHGTDDFRLEVPIVDGAYRARVRQGRQVVRVVRTDTRNTVSLALGRAEIEVVGATTLDVAVGGGLRLTVHVRGERGADIPWAGVLVLSRELDPLPAGGAEVFPLFQELSAQGLAQGLAAITEPGGSVSVFEHLEPRIYTVCAGASPGDLRDPVIRQKVVDHPEAGGFVCTRLGLEVDQEITIAVPPAAALPP